MPASSLSGIARGAMIAALVLAYATPSRAADIATSYGVPGGAGQRVPPFVMLCPSADGTNTTTACVLATVATPPATTPSTMTGGTVTTGGTFQQVLAANAIRTSCSIQNTSTHTAYVYWLGTGTATLLNSLQVQPGQTFFCQNPVGAPIKTAIQWTTATATDPFVVAENQ